MLRLCCSLCQLELLWEKAQNSVPSGLSYSNGKTLTHSVLPATEGYFCLPKLGLCLGLPLIVIIGTGIKSGGFDSANCGDWIKRKYLRAIYYRLLMLHWCIMLFKESLASSAISGHLENTTQGGRKEIVSPSVWCHGLHALVAIPPGIGERLWSYPLYIINICANFRSCETYPPEPPEGSDWSMENTLVAELWWCSVKVICDSDFMETWDIS